MAVMLIISALSLGTFASLAENGKSLDFSLTNGAGMQNEYVTIKMAIDENPGFWCFQFGLFYDSDALILREVNQNKDFTNVGDFSEFSEKTMNNLRSQYSEDVESGIYPMQRILRDAPKYGVNLENSYITVIEYESDSLFTDNMYTGDILELTFEVVGIAKDGDYTVSLVPDVSSIINTSDEYIDYSWKNAVITIGTNEAKPDDNKQITPDDTLSEEEIKQNAATDSQKPIDTFIDEDDGKTYYIGNDGEKHEYDPSVTDNTVGDNSGAQSPSSDNSSATSPDDLKVDTDKDEEKEAKTSLILYIVIGAAVLLIIAAVLLFIFISKTKKETDDIENK